MAVLLMRQMKQLHYMRNEMKILIYLQHIQQLLRHLRLQETHLVITMGAQKLQHHLMPTAVLRLQVL